MDHLIRGRKRLIVAHPDDETLWAGGLLLRHPGQWSVLCCSMPDTDPERADAFYVACERLGARGTLIAQRDRRDTPLDMSALDVGECDVIVTHGLAGEYGHPHHAQVAAAVRERATVPVIGFGYESGETVLTLTAEESAAKRHALQAYEHTSPSDRAPKWQALLERYGAHWLARETYDLR